MIILLSGQHPHVPHRSSTCILDSISATATVLAPKRLLGNGRGREKNDKNLSLLNATTSRQHAKRKRRQCSECGSTDHIRGGNCQVYMRRQQEQSVASNPLNPPNPVANRHHRRPELSGSQHCAALNPLATGSSRILDVHRQPDYPDLISFMAAQRLAELNALNRGE